MISEFPQQGKPDGQNVCTWEPWQSQPAGSSGDPSSSDVKAGKGESCQMGPILQRSQESQLPSWGKCLLLCLERPERA